MLNIQDLNWLDPTSGILVDLTTKVRKCDSRHLMTKVSKWPFLRVNDYVCGKCLLIVNGIFGGLLAFVGKVSLLISE